MANPVFPTLRKYYPGINNPLFISDIVVADDNVLQAMRSIMGVTAGDFYIISGLEYTLGTPNSYAPGIVYYAGDFFYSNTAFNEGLRLQVNYVDVLSETFDDTIARNIYTNQQAASTSSTGANITPIFTGNMNAYRLSNKFIQQIVLSLQTTVAGLGTAAEADLGTGTGQILTADQTYTQAQVNALLMTRAPSTPGSIVEVYDFDGTFPANFNGSGLGTVYPWYNSATGERWGLMNGIAIAGGHTAPNLAGKTTIGQGTDAGSHTFTEGTTYGANTYTLLANDIPSLLTAAEFENTSGSGTTGYITGPVATKGGIGVNSGTTNTPLNMMQSSLAVYKVIRLV